MTVRPPRAPGVCGWAWKTRGSKHQVETQAELPRRILADLESCRLAWEHDLNPLALVEALLLSGLPEWLKNALIVNVFAHAPKPAAAAHVVLKKAWRQCNADRRDVAMARFVVMNRSGREALQTWTTAFGEAAKYFAALHDENVGTETVKQAHRRVVKGLREGPHRYFGPASNRSKAIAVAMSSLLEIVTPKVSVKVGKKPAKRNTST